MSAVSYRATQPLAPSLSSIILPKLHSYSTTTTFGQFGAKLYSFEWTLRLHRRYVDGRQYVVYIDEQAQTGKHDSDLITLASNREWTHLVLALDVTGCRSISLHPLDKNSHSAGIWYRVIPRERFATQKSFVCSYRGRTLRDMIDAGNPRVPLFDTVPPFLRLRWFAESTITSCVEGVP